MSEVSSNIEDMKCWPFNGFAPGGYRPICKNCGKPFIGDKRATSCLPCAVNEAKFGTIEVGAPLSMGVFTKDAPVEIVFAPNGGCILRQTLGLGYVANVLGAYSSVADMLEALKSALASPKTGAAAIPRSVDEGHFGPG